MPQMVIASTRTMASVSAWSVGLRHLLPGLDSGTVVDECVHVKTPSIGNRTYVLDGMDVCGLYPEAHAPDADLWSVVPVGSRIFGPAAYDRHFPHYAGPVARGSRPDREGSPEGFSPLGHVAEAPATRTPGIDRPDSIVGHDGAQHSAGSLNGQVDPARLGMAHDVGQRLSKHGQQMGSDGVVGNSVDRAVETDVGLEAQAGTGLGDEGQDLYPQACGRAGWGLAGRRWSSGSGGSSRRGR